GEAYLYGADATEQPGTQGLNAFFLLVDEPEVYNLPPEPAAPDTYIEQSWRSLAAAAAALLVATTAAVLSGKIAR
ncbi:MAG: 4Fe-4S dicluster domain-containing protein, partial [Actinomycetota bacterium]